MPAAAVIPAPIAYIKVVAVKKLVVRGLFRTGWGGHRPVLARQVPNSFCREWKPSRFCRGALDRVSRRADQFTLNK